MVYRKNDTLNTCEFKRDFTLDFTILYTQNRANKKSNY